MKHTEKELKKFALLIRRGIVEAIENKGGGHIGGSLDLAELLSVLYNEELRVRPEDPNWENRDYIVCSKGHAGPAIYVTLALKGFFPYERLYTLNRGGTTLPGHCDRMKVPGVDATTGSLGQGLSISCGLALASKISGRDQKTYCILGDGELAEGQNWEAAQFASHYKLGRLTAFLDWNKMQIDGSNDQVMKLGDAVAKFRSFGWDAVMVDGSDVLAIDHAIKRSCENTEIPSMIVLDTVKGGNIACIANLPNNHCIGLPHKLAEQAMQELDKQEEKLDMEGAK